MLKEIPSCKQIPGEPHRRWFTDSASDLIIWYADNQQILGFQYCYGKTRDEHALTWREGIGFSHNNVDSGDMYGFRSDRLTPILIPDGKMNAPALFEQFTRASAKLESEIIEFICTRLREL